MFLIRIPLTVSLSLALPVTTLARQPLAAVTTPASNVQLSEDEKLEHAKKLYAAAERLARRGKWAEAADSYEQAYYLVPGKHGFAYKIAAAAYEAGDCDRAQDYLLHFLTYGDNDKHLDELDEAQRMIEEIDASGCASQTSFTKLNAVGESAESEDPFKLDEDDEGNEGNENDKGLLIGGVVLLALGGAGLGLGTVSAAMATSTRNELDGAGNRDPSVPSEYFGSNFTCNSVALCPSELEDQLVARRNLSAAGFVAGSVLLVGGAALLTLRMLRRGKLGGKEARVGDGPRLTGLGPTWVPGGGGVGVALEF
ncbi:hypothetical protein DB30_02133 [Enhygromyxa salina]|uniref:Uncharacterized protein n=1 Tax=Enhygromyxa salina TaxID=215803 RepID=A0A0C2CQL9_9BACT|nr:hypothetical protein [Enhygromyxa salina]KIG12015.1 hypothetical protein DB30_02133 [Enhygromyxa salina]